MQLLMFTKMLKNTGGLSLEEASDCIAGMGFDGADLTVREGGYVLPEEASENLSIAIRILNSKGLDVPMITTNITDAHGDYAEEIFESASRSGVKCIKLGYWRYEGFGKISAQVKQVKRKIRGIYDLGRAYNVCPVIHTHAGPYLCSDPALISMFMEGYDPEWLGVYVDPGHLFAESGPLGMEMGLDLLAPYVRLVSVKNYRWQKAIDSETGESRWRIGMKPLREEIVNWPLVFKCLRSIGFDYCVSVHSEYEELAFEELIQQTKEDLKYLKEVLRKTCHDCD